MRQSSLSLFSFILCVFYVSVVNIAFADPSAGDKEHCRHKPPIEAFEACSSEVEGAQCTFEGHRGQIVGSCFTPRHDEGALVCKPDRKNDENLQDS